ncbi:MAG TPA: EAL domain-containing protein [Vicinamibacteria bacterium]|nr:EAL domain-containing protein [Vicinamibacteria bacterium]
MREGGDTPRANALKPEDFRRLVDASPTPLATLSAEGLVRYVAPALRRSLGRDQETLEGASFDAIVHPDDRGAFRRLTHPGERRRCELRLRQRDGGWKVHEVFGTRFVDSSGESVAILECRDLGDQGGSPRHHPATGLPNRATFVDRVARTLGRAKRTPDHSFAVLAVQLDRFEILADADGGADLLLPEAATRLCDTVRPHDTVAHLGGDQFGVLVDRLHASEDALRAAERIHRSMARADVGKEVLATASIGATVSGNGYEQAEELLRDAEVAMARARATGSSRTELFDRGLHARATSRLRLESELRAAVERDEFTVHYQPIVELGAGRIAGFEALVRWRHPERGLVAPGEFVGVAEQTGLIVPMCATVLRLACSQARAWQDLFHRDPPISVSMNFTGPQFTEGAVMDAVVTSLQAAGLEGRQLVMEIKESVAERDPDGVVAVLLFLKSLGVEVHLDDFGAGTSSLSVLQRRPADALKIDRSLMGRVDEDPGAAFLMRAIVDLAHGLGRRVVAEGIETARELARARELGCEFAQGFYFGRPMEAEAASTLLAHEARW